MSDSCNCFDIKVEVMMDEPEINCEVDVSEVILCSDGEDYKRGYEEGHAKGLLDGRADGYKSGYDEGYSKGYSEGYEKGKAEGLTEGYDNGYTQGKADGYKDGYDEGYSKGYSEGYKNGKSELDAYFEQKFNQVTLNGTRTNYANVFYNSYVDDLTFKPTCNIRPVNAAGMFTSCLITNLLQILEERNVVLDMSNCTNFNQWIHNSLITHLPCISFEGLPEGASLGTAFYNAIKLVYIAKIIIRKDLVWETSTFNYSNALTTIAEIEGEFGTSLNMSSCMSLDEATVQRIINGLADLTGQDSQTLTLHATVKAKLTDEQIATITNKNWTLA